nr:EOG090X0JDB [Ilyocryptus agilis]
MEEVTEADEVLAEATEVDEASVEAMAVVTEVDEALAEATEDVVLAEVTEVDEASVEAMEEVTEADEVSVEGYVFMDLVLVNANSLSLTFTCPAQVLYNKVGVKQVDVPSFSGSFGILPSHVPTLAVLKPGVVTVFEQDGNSKKYFVSSGTVTINDDSSVQLLAEEAVPVSSLDVSVARELLSQAQSQYMSASSDKAKAEAQIGIEVSEALVKACE